MSNIPFWMTNQHGRPMISEVVTGAHIMNDKQVLSDIVVETIFMFTSDL